MTTILEFQVPKTKKELKKIDLNKICFLQSSYFTPNSDCAIMNFTNKPLKYFLEYYLGKEIVVTMKQEIEKK